MRRDPRFSRLDFTNADRWGEVQVAQWSRIWGCRHSQQPHLLSLTEARCLWSILKIGILMIFQLWRPNRAGQATGSVETSLPLVYSAALEGRKNQQTSRLIGQMVKPAAGMTEISWGTRFASQLANQFLGTIGQPQLLKESLSHPMAVSQIWYSLVNVCIANWKITIFHR